MNNKKLIIIFAIASMMTFTLAFATVATAQNVRVDKNDVNNTPAAMAAALFNSLGTYNPTLNVDFEVIHSTSGGFVLRDKNAARATYTNVLIRVIDSSRNRIEYDIPVASLPFFIRKIKHSPENYIILALAYDTNNNTKSKASMFEVRSFTMCGKLLTDPNHKRTWAKGDLTTISGCSWQAPNDGSFWEIGKVQDSSPDFILLSGEKTPQPTIDTAVKNFDKYKKIKDNNENFFGIPKDTDAEPKLIIVVTQSPGAGGFFSPSNTKDSYEETGVNGGDQMYSDKMDEIHLDESTYDANEYHLNVFAHEYQHLIHYHMDNDEKSFVNEGMSMLAEDMNDLKVEDYKITKAFEVFIKQRLNFISTFNTTFTPAYVDRRGRFHPAVGALDSGRYGMCYLFARFFYEGFTNEDIKKVVANPVDDIVSYNNYLELFQKFTVAMMINNKEHTSWPEKHGFNSKRINLICESTEVKFNSKSNKYSMNNFSVHNASANFFSIVYDKPTGEAAKDNFFPPITITLEDSANAGIDEFDAIAVIYTKYDKDNKEYTVKKLPKKINKDGIAIAEDTIADFGDKVVIVAVACLKYKFSEHDTPLTDQGLKNDENFASNFTFSVANAENLAITKPADGDFVGGKKNELEALVIAPDLVTRTKKVKFYYLDITRMNNIDSILKTLGALSFFTEITEAPVNGNTATANFDVSGSLFVHEHKYLLLAVGLDDQNKETARSIYVKDAMVSGKVSVEIDKECKVSIDSPSNGTEFSEPDITVTGSIYDFGPVTGTLNGTAVDLACKNPLKDKKNNYTFSSKQTLKEGSNVFTLEGRDKFDNSGKHKIMVYYKKKKKEDKPKPEDVKHGDPTFIQVDREDE